MISLKKHIDKHKDELLDAALHSYRDALAAMGDCGTQACPHSGQDIRQNLLALVEHVSPHVSAEDLVQTEQQVNGELRKWGRSTAEYYKQKTGEVREIMMILARTAETACERDQKYTIQFSDFTQRLQAIADLEDLTQIRASIRERAIELKGQVQQLSEESQESVAQLKAEVLTYQTKLEKAEQLAAIDQLTGMANRRGAERKLAELRALGQPFCLMMLDLNGFKKINDTYGHLAGDDLLKQFSAELKAQVRSGDFVGRWGGDEFVALMSCRATETKSLTDRIRQWAFGDYSILVGEGKKKVHAEAAIGIAEWRPGESLEALLDRADAAMYCQKAAPRNSAGLTPAVPATKK